MSDYSFLDDHARLRSTETGIGRIRLDFDGEVIIECDGSDVLYFSAEDLRAVVEMAEARVEEYSRYREEW